MDTTRVQRQLEHDLLGRLMADEVVAVEPGLGVDTAVDRIERSYDSHDRVVEARSLDGRGAPLDRVTWQYDADGHLTQSTQEHGSGVSLSV